MSLSLYALPALYVHRQNINILSEVLDIVSDKTGVARADIEGPKRIHSHVTARFIYFYIARKRSKASLDDIGEVVGNRDHTTVLNGVVRIKKWMEKDVDLREQVLKIDCCLNSMVCTSIDQMINA